MNHPLGILLCAGFAFVGTGAFTAPAQAHAFLESAAPAAGNIVLTAPPEIVLHFTEGLEPAFSTLKVTDDAAKPVTTGATQIDGKIMRVPLAKLPPGQYRVEWRAVSVDTHQTQGGFNFRVAMGSKETISALPAKLAIEQSWARATPPGAPTAAGYVRIANNTSADDTLLSAASPAAAKIEIHVTSMANNIMAMRLAENGVVIPAGGTLFMEPAGGDHLMFVAPKMPFKQGDHIPVTLHFAKAGDVSAVFTVESVGAMAPSNPDTNAGTMKMH